MIARLLRRYPRLVWVVPLALVLLNGSLLSVYRAVYAGRVEQLRSTLRQQAEVLKELGEERSRVQELVAKAEESRLGVEALYRDHFATERERLTGVIGEVKNLAQRSGLVKPDSISYPEEPIERYGLIKKTIQFSVEGSYLNLRRFINFLEVSDSFLVLEGVQVAEGDPNLRINLAISTYFASSDHAEVRNRQRIAGSPPGGRPAPGDGEYEAEGEVE